MPQENRNTRERLVEHFRRYELLVRTQAEDSELFQPHANRIANAVSQVARRWQVDLYPRSFLMDPRSNRIAEHILRQRDDFLSKDWVFCRVLNRVCRKGAAVSNEMPEQPELRPRHRVAVWALENSRQRDVVAGLQLIKTPPTAHRQELVIGGCSN